MKRLLFSMLICPFISMAQKPMPRYENDTLYTSSGYKIFRGQTLEFEKGTMRDGRFRYIKVKNGFFSKTLTGRVVIVKEITKYAVTVIGNGYVDITGYLLLDGSREMIVLHIAIDRAIENSPDLPSELKVPGECRNTRQRNIKQELTTAKNLYEDKVIKKEEYAAMKKKILNQ
ncbi:MAG: hypothetical protein WBO39_08430 [Ferruginibacter sp.]